MEIRVNITYHCSGSFSFTATDAGQLRELAEEKLRGVLSEGMIEEMDANDLETHIYLGDSSSEVGNPTGNISALYLCGGGFNDVVSADDLHGIERAVRDKVREHIGDNPTRFVYSWKQDKNDDDTDGE